MGRRRNKADSALLASAIVVGGIGWLISKAVDSVGGVALAVGIIAVVSLIVAWRVSRYKARVAYLRATYGDETIVQRILRKQFWQGQTVAQLTESLGHPLEIDSKLMATRHRQVWKYNRRGVNRYGLRITVDDGIVNGWDQK